jgi:hypothetical protein
MATQKRASRSSASRSVSRTSPRSVVRGNAKKASKSTAPSRGRSALKSASSSRRKRSSTVASPVSTRSRKKPGGVIKRAIRRGISELAKVGT